MARNIDGLVLNGQSYDFTVTDTNLADIETDAGAASKAYAVGEHLILDGVYYVVTAPIAENDGLVVGTNINVATVGAEITGLRNSFSQALTDLKATPIAQAVGAVGTTFASVIAKLAEIVNHGAWSANMSDTGSVTIPAGYHDGTGTVKTNGTLFINSNGTYNVSEYAQVVATGLNIGKQSFTIPGSIVSGITNDFPTSRDVAYTVTLANAPKNGAINIDAYTGPKHNNNIGYVLSFNLNRYVVSGKNVTLYMRSNQNVSSGYAASTANGSITISYTY